MRRRRRAGGQTLVEFSLVLPIFMVVIFATIDFGGYFGARLSVENAARAGDRVAVVETQAGFSGASIVNAISAEAQDNGGLPMNADCFWNGTTLTPTTYPPFTFSGKGCIGVWYFQLEQVGSPQLCTQWSVANSAFGSYSGSTWTAMPIFIRLVRIAIALAMLSGAARTERSGALCSSASHMTSRPAASAWSTCSNDSEKASASVCPGRR